jgi:hypothetical protein
MTCCLSRYKSKPHSCSLFCFRAGALRHPRTRIQAKRVGAPQEDVRSRNLPEDQALCFDYFVHATKCGSHGRGSIPMLPGRAVFLRDRHRAATSIGRHGVPSLPRRPNPPRGHACAANDVLPNPLQTKALFLLPVVFRAAALRHPRTRNHAKRVGAPQGHVFDIASAR